MILLIIPAFPSLRISSLIASVKGLSSWNGKVCGTPILEANKSRKVKWILCNVSYYCNCGMSIIWQGYSSLAPKVSIEWITILEPSKILWTISSKPIELTCFFAGRDTIFFSCISFSAIPEFAFSNMDSWVPPKMKT